jgi:hypothetical protein
MKIVFRSQLLKSESVNRRTDNTKAKTKKKKNKRANNDFQYTTYKTKDRITETPLKSNYAVTIQEFLKHWKYLHFKDLFTKERQSFTV